LLVWIVLSFGTFTSVYSQHIILIEDETHHCFTEAQTKFWVTQQQENQVHEGTIIDLEQSTEAKDREIEKLEDENKKQASVIEAQKVIIAAQDTIQDIDENIQDLSEEQLKKLRKKKKLEKAWKVWIRPTLIGLGSGLVGYGLGSIPK